MIVTDDMKPVAEWTDQEVFDWVVRHLGEQRRQSSSFINSHSPYSGCLPYSPCAYRGGKAGCLACALGCLIPPKLYFAGLEGRALCDFHCHWSGLTEDERKREDDSRRVAAVFKSLGVCFDGEEVPAGLEDRYELLRHLQDIHDGGSEEWLNPASNDVESPAVPTVWPLELRQLAANLCLDATVVDQAFPVGWSLLSESEA